MYKKGTIMVAQLVSQTHIERVFFRAVELLFPDLDKNDSRYVKIASYARRHYFNKSLNRICVLCAIPGTKSEFLKDFYAFCKRHHLEPGRREVIISDMDLFFSEDYRLTPILLD